MAQRGQEGDGGAAQHEERSDGTSGIGACQSDGKEDGVLHEGRQSSGRKSNSEGHGGAATGAVPTIRRLALVAHCSICTHSSARVVRG